MDHILKGKKIFDVELLVNMQLLCKEKKFLYTKLRICTNVNLRIYIAAKKGGEHPNLGLSDATCLHVHTV